MKLRLNMSIPILFCLPLMTGSGHPVAKPDQSAKCGLSINTKEPAHLEILLSQDQEMNFLFLEILCLHIVNTLSE